MQALHRAGSARLRVLLLAISLGLLLLTGCGSSASNSSPAICGEAARTPLLKANLDPWTLSAPFTVPAGSVAWIQVTKLPLSDEGLFGTINGIAELRWIRSGATPNIVTQANGYKDSSDPLFEVKKGLAWQELPLAPGAWQLYSFSDPGIEVVSCVAVKS